MAVRTVAAAICPECSKVKCYEHDEGFAELIAWLGSSGYSQARIARRLGVSLSLIQKMTGKRVGFMWPEATARQVISLTAKEYGVTMADLVSRSRKVKDVIPRHVAMYRLRETHCHLLLQQIALLFHRDHSTVIYGVKRGAALDQGGGR
jgi:hypothetical protein